MVRIIRIDEAPKREFEPSAACIGYFDGMHRGHQKLIGETIRQADRLDCEPAMICFSPDPASVITGIRQPHLFSEDERFRIVSSFGISLVYVIRFDHMLMDLTKDEFIKDYLERMNIRTVVCGQDYRFGKNGKGDPSSLKESGSFDTIVLEEERYENEKISSTLIKKTVSEGDFRLSERLLGFRYYFILDKINDENMRENGLTKAILHDPDCVIAKDGRYEGFEIRNGIFFIKTERIGENKETIRLEV